jgi:Citrate transporter
MNLQQAFAFAVLFGMMVMFAWGKLRYDLVAVLGLLIAVLVGIVPYDKAFTGFSDDVVIIVASALLVSAAVARSGVIERAIRPVAPYLTSDRANCNRDGPVGVREEHRRAGDDDAGRVPARAPQQPAGLGAADADVVRRAARRHRDDDRHVAQHHRVARAPGDRW